VLLMELYQQMSYELAERLTRRYSTSFSMSSRLFASRIRPHIYAVYGMVRLAEGIVRTVPGDDAIAQLDNFESVVYRACKQGYSTNPIVHAFALTAQKYGIERELISPFFASMRMDMMTAEYDEAAYRRYIYGSAGGGGVGGVRGVGEGDAAQYGKLRDGASHLGAAYQKVNFLRDMKADYEVLGRVYFPGVDYPSFSETSKRAIEADIAADFALAKTNIKQLPLIIRRAVRTSILYYEALFRRLQKASVADIKARRIRVPNSVKLLLFVRGVVGL